jgi:hypothetical protein
MAADNTEAEQASGTPRAPSRGSLSFPVPVERVEECVRACGRRGVCWDGSQWLTPPSQTGEAHLPSPELCVFGDALPASLKRAILRGSLRNRHTSILVCPSSNAPISRVLILNQRNAGPAPFLDLSAQLCQALGVKPVVLTVAGSLRMARLCQQFAEERFAGHRLCADHDVVTGSDVLAAVRSDACWRRCSHVFVERQEMSPWLSWLRSGALERLLGLAGSLTLLGLPGQAANGCPSSTTQNQVMSDAW